MMQRNPLQAFFDALTPFGVRSPQKHEAVILLSSDSYYAVVTAIYAWAELHTFSVNLERDHGPGPWDELRVMSPYGVQLTFRKLVATPKLAPVWIEPFIHPINYK